MPLRLTTGKTFSGVVTDIELIDFSVDLLRQEIHFTVKKKTATDTTIVENVYSVPTDRYNTVLQDVQARNTAGANVYNSIKGALYAEYTRQTNDTGTVI